MGRCGLYIPSQTLAYSLALSCGCFSRTEKSTSLNPAKSSISHEIHSSQPFTTQSLVDTSSMAASLAAHYVHFPARSVFKGSPSHIIINFLFVPYFICPRSIQGFSIFLTLFATSQTTSAPSTWFSILHPMICANNLPEQMESGSCLLAIRDLASFRRHLATATCTKCGGKMLRANFHPVRDLLDIWKKLGE